MGRKYLHFTDLEGAKAISGSGQLWQSSYGPKGAVFAVIEGGAFVPNVQMSNLGRAKSRSAVVVFETKLLPDNAFPEEVMWHVNSLPVKVLEVITPSVAKKMLNDSIPFNEEVGKLEIPLHPAFNDWGDGTRMPEDFKPWVPGQDNKKYLAAHELWLETKDVDGLRELWNEDEIVNNLSAKLNEIKNLIKSVVFEVLS